MTARLAGALRSPAGTEHEGGRVPRVPQLPLPDAGLHRVVHLRGRRQRVRLSGVPARELHDVQGPAPGQVVPPVPRCPR